MVVEIDKVKDMIEFDYPLHGRDMILTSVEEVNAGNVVSVLGKAIGAHSKNKREIEYLHQYVQGIQPILKRIKRERPEICNKIIINRANEIVAFKVANFIGSPLQYVSRGSQKSLPKKLDRLNAFLLAENKASKDMSLALSGTTNGTRARKNSSKTGKPRLNYITRTRSTLSAFTAMISQKRNWRQCILSRIVKGTPPIPCIRRMMYLR